MKKSIHIITIVTAILLTCCNQKHLTNLSPTRRVIYSINNSDRIIENENKKIIADLKENSTNQQNDSTKAKWRLDALKARQLTDEIIIYINSLKQGLKKEAGNVKENAQINFQEDNTEAPLNFLINSKNAVELNDHLKKYKINILSLNSDINTHFADNINFRMLLNDPLEAENKSFAETFFKNTNTITALAVLYSFENNVLRIENEVLNFCKDQIVSLKS